MKKQFYKLTLLLIACLTLFSSCEEDENNKLLVKFINDAESEYSIISIRLLQMGKAGDHETPVGEFGENIIENGKILTPGDYEMFELEIPNLHYAYYRLTVIDGQGNVIYLYDQENYEDLFDGTITHWGGDDRTVSATLKWDESLNIIFVQSWSDWVGID